MNIIDEGLIKPQEIIQDLLGVCHSSDELNSLCHIENHKGNWKFFFTDVPEFRLLLHLVNLFETKYGYDYLDEIIFNHGQKKETKFQQIAGCEGSPASILKVLYFCHKSTT